MTQLLPQGTIRRTVFEFLDRCVGKITMGEFRPVSNLCGERILAGKDCPVCTWICEKLSRYVESRHCERNVGKP